jgi:hypothetical protein
VSQAIISNYSVEWNWMLMTCCAILYFNSKFIWQPPSQRVECGSKLVFIHMKNWPGTHFLGHPVDSVFMRHNLNTGHFAHSVCSGDHIWMWCRKAQNWFLCSNFASQAEARGAVEKLCSKTAMHLYTSGVAIPELCINSKLWCDTTYLEACVDLILLFSMLNGPSVALRNGHISSL